MGQAALPNGYGPGRRDDLVDRQYGISDGLGQKVMPDRSHLIGISLSEMSQVAQMMFRTPESYKSFDVAVFDYPPIGGCPGDWYYRWALRVLEQGTRGWFDNLRNLQPRCHALLTGGESTLLSGFRRRFENGPPNPGHHASAWTVLVIHDRVINLRPYAIESPEESAVGGFMDDALPEVLVRTWWYRTAGYQIVREVPMSIHEWAQPLLQSPSCGTGVNQLVAALGPSAKRKYMPVLQEMFGIPAVTKKYMTGRVAFLCIIDTRPPETVATACGDQLLVHMARKDQTVYHVRACRFDQMKKLDPASLAECFDRYFAHVLARVPGEFDFTPFLVPL